MVIILSIISELPYLKQKLHWPIHREFRLYNVLSLCLPSLHYTLWWKCQKSLQVLYFCAHQLYIYIYIYTHI